MENTIKKAHDELKESRAQQAEARYIRHTTSFNVASSDIIAFLSVQDVSSYFSYLL